MAELLSPKPVTVIDGEGNSCTFIISKFNAVEGLKINLLYPTSLAMSTIPKLGTYDLPEELMFLILKYVAIEKGGHQIRLETPEVIRNHVPDWEALLKVIWEVMQYNSSFIRNGTISDFLGSVIQKTMAKISEIYTLSSAQSSTLEKPLSTNSAPSTQSKTPS